MNRIEFLQEVKKKLPPNPVCVELGVLYGDFSRKIIDILNPRILFLVDPFSTDESDKYVGGLPTAYSTFEDYKKVLNDFYLEVYNKSVVLVRLYSYDFVKIIKDDIADFVYIDSNHKYEAVKKDLNDWFIKLSPNGIMCGHDYVTGNNFGVIKAVDEFCLQNNLEIDILSDEGDWSLKRK